MKAEDKERLIKAIELVRDYCDEKNHYCNDCPIQDYTGHCAMRGEPWTWGMGNIWVNMEKENADETVDIGKSV